MNLVDRTSMTASILQTRNHRNIFSHGNASARRRVESISGIILHQTSFVSADISRMDYVIANFVVMQDGTVLKVRDPSMQLNSIGTNQHAIDIEFVGDYSNARELRDPLNVSGPPITQLHAGRELITFLRRNYAITSIYAHSQFTPKNCPGPQLWYNVGEWAVRQGLSSRGRGNPVPADWQDAYFASPGISS